jgi:hypothetical protein
MSRQTRGGSPACESYNRELREAISHFLPHQGLPLLSDDKRVRFTARMLAMLAVVMAWSRCDTLIDRFDEARAAVVGFYGTRRRPGGTLEGFCKALSTHGTQVLAVLCNHWRKCLMQLAGPYWKIEGWILFGVDGSKFDCPRTAANEQGFGISGKNKSGPQQLLTCLFHVGCGVLWGWVRDGVQGDGEITQLKKMLHLLPPEAMLLADAGYTGYELLKALIDRGNSFLIRVGSNVTLIRKLGYVQREGKQIVYLWPLSKQGRNKRSMPRGLEKVHPPLVLRLIELKDAKGKPVFLLTNVCQRSRLSDASAARMYRLRWGVEVMWRGLKQTMGHHKMLGKTPDRAGAELDWAMAGLWMTQLISVKHMIDSNRNPRCQSPAATLRVLRHALSGRHRDRRSLSMKLLLAVKDEYRRNGSKNARNYPKKRPQRPPGRPEARMASAIEKRLIQRILAQPPPDQLAA